MLGGCSAVGISLGWSQWIHEVHEHKGNAVNGCLVKNLGKACIHMIRKRV